MITILRTANVHINNLYYYFPLKVTCGIRYKQTQLCLRREFLTKHTMNPWGLTNMCEALFISCSLPKQYFFTRRLSSRIANFNVDWWKRENVECMSYCLRTGMRATKQVPNHQTLLHRRPKSLDLTNMMNVLLFLLQVCISWQFFIPAYSFLTHWHNQLWIHWEVWKLFRCIAVLFNITMDYWMCTHSSQHVSTLPYKMFSKHYLALLWVMFMDLLQDLEAGLQFGNIQSNINCSPSTEMPKSFVLQMFLL